MAELDNGDGGMDNGDEMGDACGSYDEQSTCARHANTCKWDSQDDVCKFNIGLFDLVKDGK